MGLFSKLFGGRPGAPGKAAAPGAPLADEPRGIRLAGDQSFEFEIAGEARRQGELGEIVGGKKPDGVTHLCVATLWREPENEFDKNAVRVDIEEKPVGYLPREDAFEYCEQMSALNQHPQSVGFCAAMIVGGWDRGPDDRGHFGVKLDLVWPIELHKS